jgi:ketosteroid isomerase-like protein
VSSEPRLSDRESIREVLYRYCRAIDRRDLQLLMDCYQPDSVDQRPSFTDSGPEFCVYAMKTVGAALFTHHCIYNVMIEFRNDRAFVESYVHAVHRVEAHGRLVDFLHYGRYCDIFELRNGAWKIAHRLHLPDGDSIVDVDEPKGRSCHRPAYRSQGVIGIIRPVDDRHHQASV